jgi:hypothetical protein
LCTTSQYFSVAVCKAFISETEAKFTSEISLANQIGFGILSNLIASININGKPIDPEKEQE